MDHDSWTRPEDSTEVSYEFFSPFAHVPGRFEWCRFRVPRHGVFDAFILPGATSQHPATVYVASDAGAKYMRERYPECTTHRVPDDALVLNERDGGHLIEGTLRAETGPVRVVVMRFRVPKGVVPRDAPYGGEGKPLWGSKHFTCWGVDLVVDALVSATIGWADARGVERLEETPALVALGSFARIAPLPAARPPNAT